VAHRLFLHWETFRQYSFSVFELEARTGRIHGPTDGPDSVPWHFVVRQLIGRQFIAATVNRVQFHRATLHRASSRPRVQNRN